jgi:hypothetical protein
MGAAVSSIVSAHDAHDHAAHPHHEGASESTADHAPLNPDQHCVGGDCPWSSLSDRPQPSLIRTQLALLPVGTAIAKMPAASSLPRIFQPGTHSRPRAPPPFS